MTLSDRGSALEQIHQLFLAHAGDDSLVIVNDGVAEVLLQTLQLHDFLLDGILCYQLDNLYIVMLTDAVGAIRCLILCRNVPPWIKMDNDFRTCQI